MGRRRRAHYGIFLSSSRSAPGREVQHHPAFPKAPPVLSKVTHKNEIIDFGVWVQRRRCAKLPPHVSPLLSILGQWSPFILETHHRRRRWGHTDQARRVPAAAIAQVVGRCLRLRCLRCCCKPRHRLARSTRVVRGGGRVDRAYVTCM